METAEEMDKDAKELVECVKGLPKAVRTLELAAQNLPLDQDFHFYNNFSQFKGPARAIRDRTVVLLKKFQSLNGLRKEPTEWPSEPDEAYDWLVGVQDDLLERVDSSLDAIRQDKRELRKRKESLGDIFGRSRKNMRKEQQPMEVPRVDVQVAKGKEGIANKSRSIPFHVRSIPRPQDKFDVKVDNSNLPFRHPRRVEDSNQQSSARGGEENIHPLEENLMTMNFVMDLSASGEPQKPGPLSPFTFVATVSALEGMAAKLRSSGEIAVDLEHHHYRSFQGFVCLMQVSTRCEDFIVDTIALRSHIGPCLQDIFADPTLKKVMHGSDRDILWLQRDFGIYVCNLFDTGQAARVLQMQGFGLAFLLHHYCGVNPDKRYQLADWRIRPLPSEMLKYAQEDTHYLLYVHDLLKQDLLAAQGAESVNSENLCLQVYERSRDICLQLYEKEMLTESSYLNIYGLQDRPLQPAQLSVLSALYSWRDQLARKEDESTGYVLPNHLLIHLAEEMPDNVRKLQTAIKGAHSLVSQSLGAVVKIIRQAKEKPMSLPLVVDCLAGKPSTEVIRIGKGVTHRDVEVEEGEVVPESTETFHPGPQSEVEVKESVALALQSTLPVVSVARLDIGSKAGFTGGGSTKEKHTSHQYLKQNFVEISLEQGHNSSLQEMNSTLTNSCTSVVVRRAASSTLFSKRSSQNILARSPTPVNSKLLAQAQSASYNLEEHPKMHKQLSISREVKQEEYHIPDLKRETGKFYMEPQISGMEIESSTFQEGKQAENHILELKRRAGKWDMQLENSSIQKELSISQEGKQENHTPDLRIETGKCHIQPEISSMEEESSTFQEGKQAENYIPELKRKTGQREIQVETSGMEEELSISQEDKQEESGIPEVRSKTGKSNFQLEMSGEEDNKGVEIRSNILSMGPRPEHQEPLTEAIPESENNSTTLSLVHFTEDTKSCAVVRPMRKGRSGLGAMLGGFGRRKTQNAAQLMADDEQVESRRKAESIKWSLALAFHPAVTAQSSLVSEIVVQDDTVAEKRSCREPDLTPQKNCDDLLLLEENSMGGVGMEETAMFGDEGQSVGQLPTQRQLQPKANDLPVFPTKENEVANENVTLDLPLSISEAHRRNKSQRRHVTPSALKSGGKSVKGNNLGEAANVTSGRLSRKEKKRAREVSSPTDQVTVHVQELVIGHHKDVSEPFDYGKAREEMGLGLLLNGRVEKMTGKKNPKLNHSSQLIFDPSRRLSIDPKPDGMKPVQRRQVFPNTGNRSASFKS